MSAETFTRRRQVGVCKTCGAPIDKNPRSNDDDGSWFHAGHEMFGHPAVYRKGQRTTLAEALVLLTAWLKWHGHVLQCEVRDEPEMRLYSVKPQADKRYTGKYLTDAADISGSPVLHSWSTIDAKTWREKYQPTTQGATT